MRTTLTPGDYFVRCDRTGFKVPASECVREWDGKIVWREVYEPRHPQDFVRGVREDNSLPFARPVSGADRFLGTNEVTSDDL